LFSLVPRQLIGRVIVPRRGARAGNDNQMGSDNRRTTAGGSPPDRLTMAMCGLLCLLLAYAGWISAIAIGHTPHTHEHDHTPVDGPDRLETPGLEADDALAVATMLMTTRENTRLDYAAAPAAAADKAERQKPRSQAGGDGGGTNRLGEIAHKASNHERVQVPC
jgi:hypothetical protein